MRKILSDQEIVAAYFKECFWKCKTFKIEKNATMTTFDPQTLHFNIFRMKKKYANLKNVFMNWLERILFPENFLKNEGGAVPESEKPSVVDGIPKAKPELYYKARVKIVSWFYKGLEGVIQYQNDFFRWKYGVEVLMKGDTEIIEVWSDSIELIESKR